MMLRYSNNICLLFDNDNPGHMSARKIMNKLADFNGDISLTCEFTPDGYKDIDEYIMNGGDTKLFGEEERIDINNVEIETLW